MKPETISSGRRTRKVTKILLGMFVGGAALSAALFVGFDVLVHETKSNEFCTSCHTMQGNYVEYQGTLHYQNRVGIQAGCSSCHVPSSGPELLWAKVRASKDLLHQFLGTVGTEEKFESARHRMAETVWKTMEATDSRECRSCHSLSNMDLLEQRPSARRYHEVAIREQTTCITCHKGIAHFLPLSNDSDTGVSKLREAAKSVPPQTTALYAIETTPFYLSADSRETNDGTLMPSAPVTRIGEDKGMIKVRIDGWRQEGVDKIAYFSVGKRVVNAVMSQDTVERAKLGQVVDDTGSGQKWTAVSVEAWVEPGHLVGAPKLIWDAAGQLLRSNCGNCHAEPDLTHFTANQWIGVVQSMQIRTAMNDEQKRLLMQYVQKHGRDMAESATH
ncbi:cytochrome C (plasmid) [Azospirillum thermophilum]|uniref:Cytochrome c-type protein n=1 Tax=Azospirillum thermophilum TaxID=2202148 RepID=A0A2S2CYE1_9PROT|nr:cytochrome C [Azospirillum thermophilum]